MTTPRISIIVPVYNTEPYLDRCIESLVNQSYKNIEIILSDDGSPDHSGVVCDNWAIRDSRIKVIHAENGGLSDARNRGVEIARGEYLCFVDSDDYVSSFFCETLLNICLSDSVSVACCGFAHVHNGAFFQNKDVVPNCKTQIWTRSEVLQLQQSDQNRDGMVTIVCNKMFHRRLFEQIRFPSGRLHEDEGTVYKLLYEADRVSYTPWRLYAYFQSPNSITRGERSLKAQRDFLFFLGERYDFLRRRNERDAARHWGDMFSRGIFAFYSNACNDGQRRLSVDAAERFRELYPSMLFVLPPRVFTLLRGGIFYLSPTAYGVVCRAWKRAAALAQMIRFLFRLFFVRRFRPQGLVVLIATPTHGNLGDQAIVYAQRKMFSDIGWGHRILEIQSSFYTCHRMFVRRLLKPEDLIVIDGGGNMGTLWIEEEYKMRNIIRDFPENRIVVFPQTVFYEDTSFGNHELEEAKTVYNMHPRLTICSREKRSFDFNQLHFKDADNLLVPDIVLYLDCFRFRCERTDILLILREDKEGTGAQSFPLQIEKVLKRTGLPLRRSSTLIDGFLDEKGRRSALFNKLHEFASARVVVTDRLHAMIFACITGTPCVAYDNLSGKVHNVYRDWLKAFPYITTADTSDDLLEKMQKVMGGGVADYTLRDNCVCFDTLKKKLLGADA